MVKNSTSVKWNTMGYLGDPTRTRLPRNYKIGVQSVNRTTLVTALWNGNKAAATIEVSFAPYGQNLGQTMAEFHGATSKNHRGKGIGALFRALVTKAVLNSGVNFVSHNGVNVGNLAAKALANRYGISLQEARHHKNLIPLSTRIVRKIGYTPIKSKNGSNSTSSVMKSTNNRTKLNNAIKRISAAINIQRAYRRRRTLARG